MSVSMESLSAAFAPEATPPWALVRATTVVVNAPAHDEREGTVASQSPPGLVAAVWLPRQDVEGGGLPALGPVLGECNLPPLGVTAVVGLSYDRRSYADLLARELHDRPLSVQIHSRDEVPGRAGSGGATAAIAVVELWHRVTHVVGGDRFVSLLASGARQPDLPN